MAVWAPFFGAFGQEWLLQTLQISLGPPHVVAQKVTFDFHGSMEWQYRIDQKPELIVSNTILPEMMRVGLGLRVQGPVFNWALSVVLGREQFCRCGRRSTSLPRFS